MAIETDFLISDFNLENIGFAFLIDAADPAILHQFYQGNVNFYLLPNF